MEREFLRERRNIEYSRWSTGAPSWLTFGYTRGQRFPARMILTGCVRTALDIYNIYVTICLLKGLIILGRNKKPSPDKVYTRNEFAGIAQDNGWTVDKNRGKGGHWWFRKDGSHPFPVPDVIGTGLQEQIKKWLKIR
jgi:hypothetical protein